MLLKYKERRQELLGILEEVYDGLKMRYPFIDNGKSIDDACPFTVLGVFIKVIQMKIALQSQMQLVIKLL